MSRIEPDGRMKLTVVGRTEAIDWRAKVEVDGFMRSTILTALDETRLPQPMPAHDEDEDPVAWGWNAAIAAVRARFQPTEEENGHE